MIFRQFGTQFIFRTSLDKDYFPGPQNLEYISTLRNSEHILAFRNSVYFLDLLELRIFFKIVELFFVPFWTSQDSENIPRFQDLEYFWVGVVKPWSVAWLVTDVTQVITRQTALTVTSLIYFQGKEPVCVYVVSYKESCDFLYLNTNKKLTRIHLFGPCLCCTCCDCMFICYPDRCACRHSYIFTIHKCTQSKIHEANARLYIFT